MAREISITKRAKISKAQQYILIAVVGTTVFLGVTIAMVMHFISRISFNIDVIAEEEKAIVSYSEMISKLGVCKKPSGGVIYSTGELNSCNPNTINVSEVPDTLRAKIMETVAANQALNSVPNQASSECINPLTKKNYTYAELQSNYQKAQNDNNESAIISASKLIRTCSALRVIPDALPTNKNEEALLSSLNKIFIVSDWEPESLRPTEETSTAGFGQNLSTISVRLAVEANSETTMEVLRNIERSIREFNITRANIEWGSSNTLVLNASATAYYMTPTTFSESTKTITAK